MTKKIKYCPVCGFKSDHLFAGDHLEDGGDWTCQNCHECVEAYVLDQAEDENEEVPAQSIPNFLWFICAAFIFTLFIFYF